MNICVPNIFFKAIWLLHIVPNSLSHFYTLNIAQPIAIAYCLIISLQKFKKKKIIVYIGYLYYSIMLVELFHSAPMIQLNHTVLLSPTLTVTFKHT